MKVLYLEDLVDNRPCSYGEDLGHHDNEFSVVKVSNIDGEGHFKNAFEKRSFEHKNLKRLLAQEGDLLVVKSSGSKKKILSGKTALVDKGLSNKIVSSNFLLRLVPKKEKVVSKYLWYLLNSAFSRNFIKTIVGATTYPNLKWELYSKHPVPYVEVPQQQQIVQILNTADTLRQKRKEQLNLLDDYIKSVFLEMFGDPVENRKGWGVFKLNEFICHLTSGGRGWSKYYSATGARFIRSFDVQMNSLSDNDTKYVNPPNNKEAERTRIKAMDILLTITGSRIGRVAVMPNNIEEAYVSQHVAIIRVKNINQLYLSYYLSMPEGGQRIIQRQQYGQTKPGLSLEQIKNFLILYPPIKLQNKFASIVEQVEQTKQKMRTSLEEMDNHFNALMQRYFWMKG